MQFILVNGSFVLGLPLIRFIKHDNMRYAVLAVFAIVMFLPLLIVNLRAQNALLELVG